MIIQHRYHQHTHKTEARECKLLFGVEISVSHIVYAPGIGSREHHQHAESQKYQYQQQKWDIHALVYRSEIEVKLFSRLRHGLPYQVIVQCKTAVTVAVYTLISH